MKSLLAEPISRQKHSVPDLN